MVKGTEHGTCGVATESKVDIVFRLTIIFSRNYQRTEFRSLKEWTSQMLITQKTKFVTSNEWRNVC